jgi:putative glycosyltransferase (TIGR04372 family)
LKSKKRQSLFDWKGKRFLVTEPDAKSFGHLAYELLAAYRAAIEEDATLLISKSQKKIVNEALLSVIPEGVRFLADCSAEEKVTAFVFWNKVRSLWAIREEIRHRRKRWIPKLAELRKNPWVRRFTRNAKLDKILRTQSGLAMAWLDDAIFPLSSPFLLSNPDERSSRAKTKKNFTPYFRRQLIYQKIPVRFQQKDEELARALATKVGIDITRPFVTLHVREAGYKFGREVSDKPNSIRDEKARNANILDYFAAIDFLVEKGYQVIRIGDPTMTPVEKKGLIDLARSPLRTELLEVWCIANSAFLFGSESGPYHVAYLLNTDCLIVNCTDPICSFPVRENCIYLMKQIRRVGEDHPMPLADILTEEYFLNLRNTAKYTYVDNTPGELVAAVAEMLEAKQNWGKASPEQDQIQALLIERSKALALVVDYVRKWGVEGDFIGAGRLAQSQAVQYCQSIKPTVAIPARRPRKNRNPKEVEIHL